jgi:hypothetical protein
MAVIATQSLVQAQRNPELNTMLIDSNGAGGSLALDSNGNPQVVFSHWDYARGTDGSITTISRIDYAVWTGSNWDIQTVDPSGMGGGLKLDSGNRPHIVYISGSNLNYSLKYGILNGGTWNIQTIDSSESSMIYSMALDSAGNPHVVYTTYHYAENYNNESSTQDIKYAYYNGTSWIIQTIDKVKISVGYNEVSITIDSNGNPHVIYLENVRFPYPSTAVGGFSFLDCYNVKYAYLSGNHWQNQTLFTNSTNLGNIVLNSDMQPTFCYEHDIYSVNIEYGSYGVNGTDNYAYWDGHEWISQPICSSGLQSGKTFMQLDSSGNPEVFFYVTDYESLNNTGIMYAHWMGSNWNIENLGVIPNSTFSFYSVNIVDLAFDSSGNPVFVADGEVANLRGAAVYGDLTYASLGVLPNTSTPNNNWLLIPVAIVIVAALALSIILFKRKNKPKEFKYQKTLPSY